MSYYVRAMRGEDLDAVTEIDREAFPTQWPPINYRSELRNRMAHYIVVFDDERVISEPKKELSQRNSTGLISRLRRMFGYAPAPRPAEPSPPVQRHYIVGFSGFWIMADEAHITSIAVREAYRGRGLGELLLVHSIEIALKMKARTVTLEVRVTNTVAQRLYRKYGFAEAGVRRGYYIDRVDNTTTREDALIMTTPDITTPAFQEKLRQLRDAFHSRWGTPVDQMVS